VTADTDSLTGEAGKAKLEVKLVFGQSAVTTSLASSPMKLLTPGSRGKSVRAFTSNFGGGLVAGDETRLHLQIGEQARCFLGTQASTKVYRNTSRRPCGHTTSAWLGEGSLLVFAPDPVQPLADSTYSQRQSFHLAAGAGLVLVDWFTAGRVACGERWGFTSFRSRNEVFCSNERTFLDSILLHSDDGTLAASHRTGRFNCFAMLLLVGPPVRASADRMLSKISQRPVERRASLVASASPVRHGALLRLAAESVEQLGHELHQHLRPLTALLGDDPWSRKW
jgi:urease accessory protein